MRRWTMGVGVLFAFAMWMPALAQESVELTPYLKRDRFERIKISPTGEYFALTLWAGVGMMLLVASEELVTLFLTLETMTICLYLTTAFEKTRRRSAEGGLKYFVYGSVSSALFLFGLSYVYGLAGTTQFEAIRLALTGTNQGPSSGLSGVGV